MKIRIFRPTESWDIGFGTWWANPQHELILVGFHFGWWSVVLYVPWWL